MDGMKKLKKNSVGIVQLSYATTKIFSHNTSKKKIHTKSSNLGQDSCEKHKKKPTVKINDKDNHETVFKIQIKNTHKNEGK
jgi:hypothetical protein